MAAEGVKYQYSLIMHKKVTFRGLLAWVVITPAAMLIGSYIVLAQKLDRLLGRAVVRGITGLEEFFLGPVETAIRLLSHNSSHWHSLSIQKGFGGVAHAVPLKVKSILYLLLSVPFS